MFASACLAHADEKVQVSFDETARTFVVTGLDPEEIDSAARLLVTNPAQVDWFVVRRDGNREPMAGRVRLDDGRLVFRPRFSYESGALYRAELRVGRLRNQGDDQRTLGAEHRLEPSPASATRVKVERVEPGLDIVPENLLRLYVHFSGPMERGDAYRHLRLLKDDGTAVHEPFLTLGEELWDPSQTRLTLLIDPGRIKQGLAPREEHGPVLEQGGSYQLVIDADWRDASGQPLLEPFSRRFRAGPADSEPPDPASWRIQTGAAGSSTALVVESTEPLDSALFARCVSVLDPKGRPIDGSAEVDLSGRRWMFRPSAAWQAGRYALVVDRSLEDLAGNAVGRPFEVDVFRDVPRTEAERAVRLPFQIPAR